MYDQIMSNEILDNIFICTANKKLQLKLMLLIYYKPLDLDHQSQDGIVHLFCDII